MVIDVQVVFIVVAGFADLWYEDKPPKHPRWRDEVFRIRGPIVDALQGTFTENWLESSGELLAGDNFFRLPTPADGATALIVTSTPTQGGSTRARVLFQTLIASARSSLQITTPYFLPDRSLRDEIIRARQRGVAVR